jgi:hypothetical protein
VKSKFHDRLCVRGQSSWLQIQGSEFDSRRYQTFWEVVDLERGPLSLVSITEELLQRKSSGSGLESLKYGRTDPSRWPRGSLYPQKLALSSRTRGGRSVGIVRSRTQAKEFLLNKFYSLSLHANFSMWLPLSLTWVKYSSKRKNLFYNLNLCLHKKQFFGFCFLKSIDFCLCQLKTFSNIFKRPHSHTFRELQTIEF